MPDKCEVLFLAANPQGTAQLALDEEIRSIEAKIRASDHRDALELVSKWAVRPDDLLQALNQHHPEVVHFSGHGSDKEELYLVDANGNPKVVSKAAIQQLFRVLKDDIRLVVFNACFSRPQAEAVVEHIDFAVGMNKAIGDEAAAVFSSSFYRAIGFGRSVQDAFDQGVTALMLEGIPEEQTPELLIREGVDASEAVLLLGDTPTPAGSEELPDLESLVRKLVPTQFDRFQYELEKEHPSISQYLPADAAPLGARANELFRILRSPEGPNESQAHDVYRRTFPRN